MPSPEEDSSDSSAQRTKRKGVSRRALIGIAGLGAALGLAGYAITRPSSDPEELHAWRQANIPSLKGRKALVTGGNGYPQNGLSGLGFHTALALAEAGADVTIASRNAARSAEAVKRIQAAAPQADVRFESLDLASLESVKAFADRMAAMTDKLDVLINNAGVMGRSAREASADGFERVFATNTLGHFALSARLLPLLRKGQAPRIVWLSSMRAASGKVGIGNLQQNTDYDYAAAYDNSKLACLIMALECERRSQAQGWGVSSLAAHPGVARTNIIPDGPGLDSREGGRFKRLPFAYQDPAQGALPILYAATSPDAVGGGYYGPQGFQGLRGLPGEAKVPVKALDAEAPVVLWSSFEALTQVSFGE